MSADESGKWLAEALRLAEQAGSEDEVPVGCVIVRDGQIVGRGYNRRETDQNPVAHAEILAILDAARVTGHWRLSDCELYVTLEPCPMCLAASQQARIQRIVYGARDPKGGAISLGYELHKDTRTHHRFDVEHADVLPACGKILTEFFSKKRKQGIT